MKLLRTTHGSHRTSDEIADAVMHYSLALAKRHDIDIVNVPFIDDSHAIRRVDLVIGWQQNLESTTVDGAHDELLEVGTIVAIYSKADALVARARAFRDDELYKREWIPFGERG